MSLIWWYALGIAPTVWFKSNYLKQEEKRKQCIRRSVGHETVISIYAFIHACPNRTKTGRRSMVAQWDAVNINFSDINVPAQLNLIFCVNKSMYPSAAFQSEKKNGKQLTWWATAPIVYTFCIAYHPWKFSSQRYRFAAQYASYHNR